MNQELTTNDIQSSKKTSTLTSIIRILISFTTCFIICFIIYFVIIIIDLFIKLILSIITAVSNLDALIVITLITGCIVIISFIIGKYLDYKHSCQEYLTKKREEPYGQFIDMAYKVQQNSKNPNSYTKEQMLADASVFSKQIILWGSSKVVKKWIRFRNDNIDTDNNNTDQKSAINNLIALEEIIDEMRKDLGSKRVKQGGLLASFVKQVVNNIKQFVNTVRSKRR